MNARKDIGEHFEWVVPLGYVQVKAILSGFVEAVWVNFWFLSVCFRPISFLSLCNHCRARLGPDSLDPRLTRDFVLRIYLLRPAADPRPPPVFGVPRPSQAVLRL